MLILLAFYMKEGLSMSCAKCECVNVYVNAQIEYVYELIVIEALLEF